MKGFERMWSLFSHDVFVDSGKKARGTIGKAKQRDHLFLFQSSTASLLFLFLIGIASGGLSGGDSRVVASLLSTLYFFFFFLTETAPFLWLRQIFSQLKCTPKICLKIH